MSTIHGRRINRLLDMKNSFLSEEESEGEDSRCESQSPVERINPKRLYSVFHEDNTKIQKEKERRAIGWKKRREIAINWKIKLTQLEKARISEIPSDELRSHRALQESIIKDIMRDFPELEGFDKSEVKEIEEITTMKVSKQEVQNIAKVIWEGLQAFGQENLALGIMRTRQYLKEKYSGNWICTLYPQDFLNKHHEGLHPWNYSKHQGGKQLAIFLDCLGRLWSARIAQTS